jgi:hypothetical protein
MKDYIEICEDRSKDYRSFFGGVLLVQKVIPFRMAGVNI